MTANNKLNQSLDISGSLNPADNLISSDEQLGLVKKLYFSQLGFQKRTQDIVKKVMLQEDNANYKLYYKTGLGYKENGNSIGWIVG